MAIQLALSLKQPWATLLVHGRKTIEVRRWRTSHRGPLIIHAARVPDERPEAWAHVTSELGESAQLMGGVIGVGNLTKCKSYTCLDSFLQDRPFHLNEPDWFHPGGMFGFEFTDLRVLPFQAMPGFVRLFELTLDDELLDPTVRGPS